MKASGLGMIVWPYLYFVTVFFLAINDDALMTFFLIYGIGGLVLSFFYGASAKGIRCAERCEDAARWNKTVKLRCIPCDVIIWGFIAVRLIDTMIASAKGSMGVGLSIMVLFLLGIPYGLTRLFMLWGSAAVCKHTLRQAVQDRRITLSTANWHIFLHLLPIVDIFSAISINRILSEHPSVEQKIVFRHN